MILKDKNKQWIAIGTSLVLLIGLFSLDIKGIEPKESTSESVRDGEAKGMPPMAAQAENKNIKVLTIQDILSATHDQSSNENEFHVLETKVAAFEKSPKMEQSKLAKELSKAFFAISNPGASAYFDEMNLTSENTASDFVQVANKYVDAFNLLQNNEALQLSYLKQANALYTKAFEKDSTNLDAKTGQGITIVNGLGMPMQGITLLLQVVEKDPKNLKANMNLGLFSMKSGQFDKAIDRFKTVISIQPDAESYFYLATAYENLKQNKEAVDAFLKSKSLAKNTTLNEFIDKKVAELQQRVN